MSRFDFHRARRDTRACNELLHFNNAGASLMPAPVSDSLRAYLREEELGGGYETAEAQAGALANFYTASAKLLNCREAEIGFIENATRAWDMVFYAFEFAPGDRILTTTSEYGSNVIAYLQQAERYGAEVVFIPDDAQGQIDIKALEAAIDERTKLISISHIPTGGGLVNPAAEVGRIARSANVPYLLDACQSVGQLPLDVEQLGCTMLTGTGRKYLRGPRGAGLLYVREDWIVRLQPPLLDQHAAELTSANSYKVRGDAKRFENWEQPFAGKAALAVAIDYALSWGLDSIWERVQTLAATLRSQLAALDGVTVVDQGETQCGIVTFTVDAKSADDIKASLQVRRINVSVCSGSGNLVSYDRRGLIETVRASVHYFNTEDEIERFIEVLASIIE